MRTTVVLVFLLTFVPSLVCGQELRVAVTVQDSAASGIFQSAFASAFRALGDVEVVTSAEAPDYVLTGLVMCNASPCDRAPGYAVALRLYEPVDRRTADDLAWYALDPTSTEPPPAIDSLAAFIWRHIEGLERTHMRWVAIWGRDVYERAIREKVGRIDAGCLDKVRARRRILRADSGSPTEQFARYQEFLESRDWIC